MRCTLWGLLGFFFILFYSYCGVGAHFNDLGTGASDPWTSSEEAYRPPGSPGNFQPAERSLSPIYEGEGVSFDLYGIPPAPSYQLSYLQEERLRLEGEGSSCCYGGLTRLCCCCLKVSCCPLYCGVKGSFLIAKLFWGVTVNICTTNPKKLFLSNLY